MILKKNYKRILGILLLFLLTLQFLASTFPMRAAAAAPYAESFDSSRIEDDLAGVDLSNYPKNPMGDIDIISFVEYSYSNQSYLSEYYGLYVYVYNPTAKDITITNGNNFVNAVVGFEENGNKIYDSVNLEYLDKTSDNLIYKFKLSRSSEFLKMAREYAIDHEGKRFYEIIELEIKHGKEIANADISKKYEWSGFAAYCDDNSSAVSTLECTDFGTRSIHLNLKSTNYRFAKKNGYDAYSIQDELNSVFFTIPDEYFEDFGNLYKVSAKWYEHKTSSMFVTSDVNAYSDLFRLRNLRINEFGQKIDKNGNVIDETVQSYYRIFWEIHGNGYTTDGSGAVEDRLVAKSYNAKCIDNLDDDSYWDSGLLGWFGDGSGFYTLGGYNGDPNSWYCENQLDWLFYTPDTVSKNAYMVSKDSVKNYILRYTETFSDQDLIRNKYASALFTYSIDDDRLQFLDGNREKNADGSYKVNNDGSPVWNENVYSGLVKMDFVLGEDSGGNLGNSFVDSVDTSVNLFWGLKWFGSEYETFNYSPIQVISEGDLYLNDEAFSEKYYVNPQDAPEIITESRRAYSNGERPVLLRFAVTDYYTSEAVFDHVDVVNDEIELNSNGYVAQETCFLDFDVLSLTFKNPEGEKEVAIGVVAVPIDIINGLTPPESLVEEEEWWQKLVALLLVIIVLIIVSVLINTYVPWLGAIFRGFFKGIVWILKQLFRLLTYPFRAIGKKVKHKANIRSYHKLSSSRNKSRTSKSKSKRGKYGKQKISSK